MDRESVRTSLRELISSDKLTAEDLLSATATEKDLLLHLACQSGATRDELTRIIGFVPDAVMLVHPRSMEDVLNRCSFLKEMDPVRRTKFLEGLWPLVLDRATYGKLNILILTLPLLPEYWFPDVNDREKHRHNTQVKERSWQDALDILERIEREFGLMPIILGALTGRMTKFLKHGGIKSPIVTGTILTPIIIQDMIEKIVFPVQKDSDLKISLIGGAGVMGRAILLWFAQKRVTDNLLVVEANEQEVRRLRDLFPEESGFHFACTCDLKKIKDSDLVIVATAAPNAIITQDMLSPNTIIIDDTHPSNVAKDVTNIVLRVMAVVPGLEYKFPMDQQEPGEAVTCFAEGILIAGEKEAFRFYDDDPSTPWYKQIGALVWINERVHQLGNVTSSFRKST
ncbi:MAG: hypothetical protein WC242_03415 [Candidatus Paceibacterota bacterium]|jgi:hypothetical protein